MTYTELTESVNLLNEEILNYTGRETPRMEIVETPVSSPYVRFLGIYLWDADNDARLGAEDEREPLEVFLRREAKKHIEHLARMWPTTVGDLDPTSVSEMLEVLRSHSAKENCSADKTRAKFRRHWDEYDEVYNWSRPISEDNFNAAMAKLQ